MGSIKGKIKINLKMYSNVLYIFGTQEHETIKIQETLEIKLVDFAFLAMSC